MPHYILETRLSPITKYPGGKERELVHVHPNLPVKIQNYYEPFVGGGAVYFSIDTAHYFINDKSTELIWLYTMVQEQNAEFFQVLNGIEQSWNEISRLAVISRNALLSLYKYLQRLDDSNKKSAEKYNAKVNAFIQETPALTRLLGTPLAVDTTLFLKELRKSLVSKAKRMKKLESSHGTLSIEDVLDNLECAMKAAFYTYVRNLSNHADTYELSIPYRTAFYFFLRQTCYSSMFRYNKDGGFNVPYGGISYNKKSFAQKIAYYKSEELVRHLAKTTIGNMDFYDFMETYPPEADDFLFLDPPYDTEFSTYAKNEFTLHDQKRLADYLIHNCQANFMLVIKNTDYIASLYPNGMNTANGRQIYVGRFDKRYAVSFQDRNNKEAEHLLITNYEPH